MIKGRPVFLMILDGWGKGREIPGNAIHEAVIPNYERLWENYPNTFLRASGEAVGLPAGQIGNSEVGHLNIGAGRIVYQDLTRLNRAVDTGELYENEWLREAVQRAKKNQKALHLMGLVSDGGVHSHLQHLFALLELARREGLKQVYIHAFLDGRDVPPTSGLEYIQVLEKRLTELGFGAIATVMGRFYAMDRDRRWDRVSQAYHAMITGKGKKGTQAIAAVKQSYERDVADEFVEPVVVVDSSGKPVGRITSGDSVIFFNFRADRAREITRALTEPEFKAFPREFFPEVFFVCMTEYDAEIKAPVAFPPQSLENTLGEVLSKSGLKQLRIAETEKYAHVTFFFNGGREEANEGEDRILIPSPADIATYDLKPEMSAYEITSRVKEEVELDVYDVIILNYANPDMLGHTGIIKAAVKGVETVDDCLGQVVAEVQKHDGTVIITSDHGNAEQMFEPGTTKPYTAHTVNKVPLILVSDRQFELRKDGSLQDIAPTILDLLGLEKPQEMTGKTLIIH